MKYWPTKTPARTYNAGLDWGPALSKLGNPTIVSSIWVRLHGDAVATGTAINGQITSTRVSGGTPNTETVFRNIITLSTTDVLDEDVFQRVRA